MVNRPQPQLTTTTNAQAYWDWIAKGGNAGTYGMAGKPINAGPRPIDESEVEFQRQQRAWQAAQDAATQARQDENLRADMASRIARSDAEKNRILDERDRDLWFDKITKLFGRGGAPAAPVPSGDDSAAAAAAAAAMGRAKDTSAAATSTALRQLRDNMASRGIEGSGIEAELANQIRTAGAGQVGEAARDLATGAAQRAQAVADRNYAGALTARGQDISAMTSLWPSLAQLLSFHSSY
jgi:hypothetical protein